MLVPSSSNPPRAFKRVFALMRLPLSFMEGEINCPVTVNGASTVTPVPLTSVILGLVKFALIVKGCETVTAVAESLMEGLWKDAVNVGALVLALAAKVVARLVPLSVIVDAAKMPLNVVVLPDAVWFAVLVLRLVMAVALVVDAADAEFETDSMAEMRVSKF
jgi:hypothetical protein